MKTEIEFVVKRILSHQKIGKEPIEKIIYDYCNNILTNEEFLPVVKAIYDYDICDEDLFYLTDAMKNSGQVLDLSSLGKVVDKHSTGGVSDTTTLIIAPICACLGVKMLKMSGRALGFTGGTCDKLECFTGYKTDLELNHALELVKQNGACVITSSLNIAPADKKIYALRDKTGLVDSIPLIASSIMSKKLASGANDIVLDVKYGNGAFMQTKKGAKLLAKKMKAIGKLAGKNIKIVYGKMDEPLGYNIGPRLEAKEALEVLSGAKNSLQKESIRLASHCVALYKKLPYLIAKMQVKRVLKSNSALEKFKQMVTAQGGSTELFEQKIPTAEFVIYSQENGKFNFTNTKKIGQIVADLTHECGAEYSKRNFVGIVTKCKNKKLVKNGDPLFDIYCQTTEQGERIKQELSSCYEII